MQLVPYLNFAGQCAEAFRFYEHVFDGKIEMIMTHGESPIAEHVPAEWHALVLHARLSVAGQMLMGSDAPPDRYEAGKGMSVAVMIDDAAKAERVFNALAEGGTINMPFEETFWAKRFGMVVDRYGTPWLINSQLQM